MITRVAQDLPLAGPAAGSAPRERSDAARNRQRILDAASALVAERGIEHVSMDDVAEAACVGTGTLYRRFGDRAGLAMALLDEETRAFQEALIGGPPPLGPGAPALERLRAFGPAYHRHLEQHAELIVAGAGREAGAPREFYVTHLRVLLREAAPWLDAEHASRALMATLDPVEHLLARRQLGWSVERLASGWDAFVSALCRG